jgi:hypothetical protein
LTFSSLCVILERNKNIEMEIMEQKEITCFNCGKVVPMHSGGIKPTWFGSYLNDKLVQAVCSECHDKGVKANDAPKSKT